MVSKFSSGGVVTLEHQVERGTFEILEKCNKVNLCLWFTRDNISKTFQLNQNMKNFSQSFNWIMLTLKNSSVIIQEKMPHVSITI